MDRIGLITSGVLASDARAWLDLPVLSRSVTMKALDLPVATFNKKVKANAKLTPAESERVVGFARLVGQVEATVEEAGVTASFDARAWLARWLTEPLPALGNAKPLEFMNTIEGQSLVSQKLAQAVSGAYG
jgi:putative toxin-antitoxin system antitoxin component (TIGR02293 family)